ncbi:hypothetical protein N0V88_004863 [Collariella sp. IMI 366227]|nr:hypothetical protein N0V88_004863 [Collariella sp. IMI 366227]
MLGSTLLTLASLITSAASGALRRPGHKGGPPLVPPPGPVPELMEGLFQFMVKDFEAKAIMLSDRNYVKFNVSLYPGSPPAHCFALGTTLTHSLTSIPQTWCHPGKDASDESQEAGAETSTQHVWFAWTMGDDVDPTGPDAAGVMGERRKTGAYLKVVRQLEDGKGHDEAIQHIPATMIQVVGKGILEREEFVGPGNWSMTAARFTFLEP